MTTMTKRQAKARLGVATDYQLAKKLGIKSQAVYAWGGDDDPIPRLRQLEIEARPKGGVTKRAKA